jgi:hypothetical protein
MNIHTLQLTNTHTYKHTLTNRHTMSFDAKVTPWSSDLNVDAKFNICWNHALVAESHALMLQLRFPFCLARRFPFCFARCGYRLFSMLIAQMPLRHVTLPYLDAAIAPQCRELHFTAESCLMLRDISKRVVWCCESYQLSCMMLSHN